MVRAALILLGASLLGGCLTGGESPYAGGLKVESGVIHGPSVVYDPLARPVAEVPFPSDLALRPADDTYAGVAWNLSTEEPSEHRRLLRERLDTLDGFGGSGPATLSFTGPLDLATVTDESVIIVNIEPGHPREGERALLDLGRGYLPLHTEPVRFFGQDPSWEATSLVFPEDNRADLDGDGVEELVTHFEFASNTLILQPVLPLAQGARHAVLITRDVEGTRTGPDGEAVRGPVRSPFPFKAHAAQAPFIRQALRLTGIPAEQLAFGWTYTTADVVQPMRVLRQGIYGEGPLARMAELVEPGIFEVRDSDIDHDADGGQYPEDPQDHRFIVQAEFLGGMLGPTGLVDASEFTHLDYFVFGSVLTPDLRTSPDRAFTINFHTGEGDIAVQEVPILVSVPKATERHQPPFPVMFYFHGTGTSRAEAIAIADYLARQGIATVSFDEVGHGPLIPDIPEMLARQPNQRALAEMLVLVLINLLIPDEANELEDLPFEEQLERLYQVGLFAELAVHGRNEDIDGDGFKDIAEAFFYADPFKMCSSFWQDLVDLMQLVKVVRGLRQAAVPSEPHPSPRSAGYEELAPWLLAGDFNADGVLDIGGPDVPFSIAGTSLGGFHATLGAAIEPEITTATPIVAGGGFTDIMLRSDLFDIVQRLLLDPLGPVVVGCPDGGEPSRTWLTQQDEGDRCRLDDYTGVSFGDLPSPPPGSLVTLLNLENDELATATVNEWGGFSVAVESDKGDALRVRIEPEGAEPVEFETIASHDGSGYVRNSKDFRRAAGVQQHAFARCDPLSFARSLFLEPLPGHPPTNVLYLNALGDRTVPISSGVILAAASGVFGPDIEAALPRLDALRAAGTMDYGHFDVDDVRGDNPPEEPGLGVTPPVASATGVSSIRFADVRGNHTWIADYSRDGFEWHRYSKNQLAIYHRCQGRVIVDGDPDCLASKDCPLLDDVESIDGCVP